jgi:hypothetical protein
VGGKTMIEIKMVCKDCDYDFFGTEQFIDNLDDDLCNDHICNDEWTHQKGYTKNTVFIEEIKKYIKKQWGKNNE